MLNVMAELYDSGRPDEIRIISDNEFEQFKDRGWVFIKKCSSDYSTERAWDDLTYCDKSGFTQWKREFVSDVI